MAMATSITGSESVLARHGFLAGTPAGALARLAAHARWIEAGPDQALVDFDDVTTDVYFVLQGSVRVLIRTANGEQTQILGDFTAGDVFGEMSAIDNSPRSARVEALVRTRLCVVPAAAFLDLALTSQSVGLRLLRLLTERLRMQNRRLLEHTTLPTRLRLIAELLRLSRVRADGTRTVSPPPTQDELASRIGARRETVSRELSILTRAGLLHRSRAAFILSEPDVLRATVEAGFEQSKEGSSGD